VAVVLMILLSLGTRQSTVFGDEDIT
jgi:hypothetical protein